MINNKNVLLDFTTICLSLLNDFKDEINVLYPNYVTKIEKKHIGNKTEYKAYNIILSCTNKDYENDPDALNMSFTIKHITTTPILCELSNIWDGDIDNSLCGAMMLDEDVVWGKEAKDLIVKSFPILKENFLCCLCSWEIMLQANTKYNKPRR